MYNPQWSRLLISPFRCGIFKVELRSATQNLRQYPTPTSQSPGPPAPDGEGPLGDPADSSGWHRLWSPWAAPGRPGRVGGQNGDPHGALTWSPSPFSSHAPGHAVPSQPQSAALFRFSSSYWVISLPSAAIWPRLCKLTWYRGEKCAI